MKTHVLFLHGAGEGAYKADAFLAESLQASLGSEYEVIYPQMPDEANAPYELWKAQILHELSLMKGPVLLVGHSLGASVLAKVLSEESLQNIRGIFLLASPFWGGEGWRYEGYQELELPQDFSKRVAQDVSVFLYHCLDDEIVPFSHVSLYSRLIPQATVRKVKVGGHQFKNDLGFIAKDIKTFEIKTS